MKKRNKFKKRRAIYLLTACQKNTKAVARDLNLKEATILRWMREPSFQEELEQSMQRIEKYDSKYRSKQNSVLATHVTDEIHRRIATTRQLQDIPLPTLLSKLKELNNEVRIDTPGDVTSRDRVEHKHDLMDKLVNRYRERAYEEGESHLKLVEMPDKDDKKEASNG